MPDMEPGTAVQTAWCASTNEPPHLLLWFESLAHGADGDEEVEKEEGARGETEAGQRLARRRAKF